MQPDYYGRQTRNIRNNTVRRQNRISRSNTTRRTGNSRSNTANQTKTYLGFSQATSQAHTFLVLLSQ